MCATLRLMMVGLAIANPAAAEDEELERTSVQYRSFVPELVRSVELEAL